ncbi:MAG: GLUG motif-containing protein [Peptococcaceae bacterium]
MSRHKTKQRLTAMMLSVIMVVGMMPVSAQAETGTFPIGTSGEITACEALGSDIAMRRMPLGTSEKDLELPDTLTATIQIAALEEEPVLDSGETDAEPDSADTASGSAIGIDEKDDTGAGVEAEIASSSDAQEDGERFEAEPMEKTVDSTDEITVPLPATWASSPEYDGEAADTYIFTPELPEGFTPAGGVEVPAITVAVGAAAPTGTVTAFDVLPEDVRWQNTTAPEFPETVGGTVEGKAVQIPVTWEAGHDYDTEYPQRGLYVFTAVLSEGYGIGDGVELPRMTVFIPVSARRMAARRAGGGTTDSPLEITTAAQLAEIATLVNARENGLELFLFNDADAHIMLELQNDIDLLAYSKGKGWMPIGTSGCPFGGVFDGGGNRITGLYINRTEHFQGLFGCVGSGGTIRNIGVENVNITGGNYVGGVAGYSDGMAENCYSTGTVAGAMGSGGVVGHVYSGTVQNCYNTGTVSGIANVGGVVGTASDGTLINCYSTGDISGTDDIGGVMGYLSGGTVQNCAALNPSVSGTNKVGRVAGHTDGGTLSGNIAFSGMTVTQDDSAKTPVEGADQVDGESKTAAGIRAAGFFEALFDNDTAWIYAVGELPGFGATLDMPEYIVDGNDSNFYGMGTSENPYQIMTAADLAQLAALVNSGDADYSNKHYRLLNDLDLSGYASGGGWTPIGNETNCFNGTFDGGGHKVTNLTIQRIDTDYQGLFGCIGGGGTIKKLGVVDASITGTQHIGGVVGKVHGGTVQNCYSSGRISMDYFSSQYVGGVAGSVEEGGAIENCYSTSAVGGTRIVGGVVGFLGGSGTVQNCYSTGSIGSGDSGSSRQHSGGVVGYFRNGVVKNCAALNSLVFSESTAGRVVGYIDISSDLSGNIAFGGMIVKDDTVSGGTLTDNNGADKSAAEISAEGFFETLFANDTVWTYAQGKLPGFGTATDMPAHLLPAGTSLFEGDGMSDNPYLIKTAADLALLAELVNKHAVAYAQENVHYKLENNIDLSAYNELYDGGKGWIPIGTEPIKGFKGKFDGNGKTITGLTINRPITDNIGLFGYLSSNSKVHNLSISDASIQGKLSVGGIAGYAEGATVENCAVIGSISGAESVGGIVGCVSGGKVYRCYSTGSVTGTGNYVGGIVGYLENAVANLWFCYSDSSISGGNAVGGLAGYVYQGKVQNCYSTGNVTGARYVGGVAGDVTSDTLQNCYSTGSVTGTEVVGGIVGVFSGGTIKNCVALNPSIDAGEYDFGRVVGGSSGILSNNYAFSRIPGTWENKGSGAKDGADVTSQILFGGNFWTRTTYWDTSAWDGLIWMCAVDKLPVLFELFELAEQSGDVGLYLTARDIQYATVTPDTTSFTYNGSQQLPTLTITFDGETLTEDTDYTVSITSTDGSGTSAGTTAGTVTLTITGIGSFYGTKNLTYTIGKKPITITPNSGQSKKYGGVEPLLIFANDGGLAPEAFTGKLSRAAGENVGTYAVSLGSVSAGDNYELSLAPGTVNFTIEQARVTEITTIVSNVNRTAYEMRGAATAQAVLGQASLPSSVSVATDGGTAMLPITWSTATIYNAKSAVYAVTGTLTGNENIDANSITKSVTVTVTPVTAVNPTFGDTLVVINSGGSATAAELGGAILPASGSITVEDMSVAYTITWNGGETLDRTTVGNEQTFTGVISYDSPPAWLTLPSGLTVSRKVTVTAKILVTIGGITTANKIYDGTSYASTGTVTCSHSFPTNQLEWLYESIDGVGYSSSTAPTNAGAYKLTVSVPESNANYAGSEMLTFSIEKRQITLTADNKTIIKGASLPQLTYTISNLPTGKTKADALSIEPVLACPTFDGNTPGSYAITLTDGTATDNYTITTRTDGILTVAEQSYTVTFNLNGGSRTGGGELTQTIAEGGAAMAPTVSRSSYTFTGWDKAFDNVTSNLTVKANWSYNGGGSGSYTPPATVPTTPEKKPDQPVTAAVPVTATAGKKGAANTTIPDKAITDAIAKAQADAKKQNKTNNGIGVSVNVSVPANTKFLRIVLTQAVLKQLTDGKVQQFEVDGKLLTISLDQKAIQEIRKQSTGDVTITIKPVTVNGVRNAYEITFTTVKNGKTVNITGLGTGFATLSIPCIPAKGEAVGYLYAVYVDGKGKLNRIADSAYDAGSGSMIFSTNHFSVYGVGFTAPSAKFTDITSHWAKESIDYVAGRGLLSGTAETTFAPNTAMTRGMLVTVLGRLANVDPKTYTTNSLTDVKADSAFRPYIEWAYKKGIVQGTGNGKFEPDRAITREEIAVIFSNYAKATGYPLPVTRTATTYADASSIGSTYKTAVTAMQQAGIMMGATGNKFNPKSGATRAEVSSMLHRYIKLTIDPATAQGWALNDDGRYMYYRDGKSLTGTQTINSVKYFFGTDGTLKTGWVKDGGNWRYYSGDKAIVGWLNISDKRYYYTKDGLMVYGKWFQIDGIWYYFYADGSLARNTKVDGYDVDGNGVRKVK